MPSGVGVVSGVISGSTSFSINTEDSSIVSSIAGGNSGQFIVDDSYIPTTANKALLTEINHNNIQISGYIYGNKTKAYTKDIWLTTQDSYVSLDSIPEITSNNNIISTIISDNISGSYMLVYDEVLPICL